MSFILSDEFGDEGADKHYVHNQIASSDTWVIIHNLGKFPSVSVVDSAGTLVRGVIVYNSLNQCTITFFSRGNPVPFSGNAYLN